MKGWWRCADCGELTGEPHVDLDGADLCPSHCFACLTGQTAIEQEQLIKNERTSLNVGDPMPGHGLPTREQMAAASWGTP